MTKAKPFDIPKREVWEAFKKVKANQGAAGVDGQTIADFEADLSNNLYELWNRLSSGSYFPPPVRRVHMPKVDGGTRPLGIPTVADRVAQEVVRRYLEPRLEPAFHADSYGYRPGKSAIDAVRQARQRCWRYDWVLDLDVKAYFDSIDWELMLRAIRRHTNQPWVLPRRFRAAEQCDVGLDRVGPVGDQSAVGGEEAIGIDGGQLVPRRQPDDHFTMADRPRAHGQHQRAVRVAREGGDAALDLVGIRDADRAQLHPERRRHGLDSAQLSHAQGERRVAKHRDSLYAGCGLLQQLQPLPADAEFERNEPRGVAARPGQALDIAGADRVGN